MKRQLITGLVTASASAMIMGAVAQESGQQQVQPGATQNQSLPGQQQGQQGNQQQGQQGSQQQGQQQGQAQQGQQDQQGQQAGRDQVMQGQRDQELAEYEPGAAVILSGTVDSIENEQFTLDYGQDQVTVDLSEWDWSGQINERLEQGQQVTVSGTIDDAWFEERRIDADNIYVTTDYAYYYIVDQNPAYSGQQSQRETQQDGTFISTRGEVKEVSDGKITLESQGTTLEVDTSELAYDPLAQEGEQAVQQGDRIYVFGDIGEDFFENRTISAESLITLSQAGSGQGQMQEQGLQQGQQDQQGQQGQQGIQQNQQGQQQEQQNQNQQQ